MSSILKSLKRNYQSLLERQSNRPFLKEVMAACTTVANAQGTVSFAERVVVDQIVNPYGGFKFLSCTKALISLTISRIRF
jgi:tellurite resistance protein